MKKSGPFSLTPAQQVIVYTLLILGSVVFVWPFLWMTMTSIKSDREMFGETNHLLPEQPVPRVTSPYIETRPLADMQEGRSEELLPVIKEYLRQSSYQWPSEVDREAAIRQTAAGIYSKLARILPTSVWSESFEELKLAALPRINDALIEEALSQVWRRLLIGQLRVSSYDLEEESLVTKEAAASAWEIDGDAEAWLEEVVGPDESFAVLHYDFSEGQSIRLSQTFETSFPVERLYQLQLYLRNDDSWHPLTVQVEKLGVLYAAERPHHLSDFANWSTVTWQESGPDDLTNKIRRWITLKEVDRSSAYESRPNAIKITIQISKNDVIGAWWAKLQRNYRLTLDFIPFWRYVATSAFLVILNVVGTMFSCSLVAYAFARLQWPGRGFCFVLMLATLMIPPQVTMIPHFLIVRHIGWFNTLYPLWVPSLFASAFYVFLLRQFLKGIPRDLEDAARIDGCGFWRIYWHVMLPLVKPTLAAIAIFTFMGTWNDFMGPLIYLADQRLYPLSLGLYAFNVQAGGNIGMMMAGSFLMTLPVIIIFFFAQKYFIQGITMSGMKG